MLSMYANQSLTLQHVATTDGYNEHTFTTSTISGRKEDKITLVRNTQGEEKTSTALVMTESFLVAPGDLIDNRPVITTIPAIDLDGVALWQRVYLE